MFFMFKHKKRKKTPKEFIRDYKRNLQFLKENPGVFKIFKKFRYEIGNHPENSMDYECKFAAYHIAQINPKNILDIGSYRHFILGILSNFEVTTLDVRHRKPALKNETVITGDAKNLDLTNNSFDMVISLCTLEHFGLGRYGDEFDLNADHKAFQEMIRVTKPGGHLIFTTTINNNHPSINFNSNKVYNYEMIKNFCTGLICVEEKFYSHKTGDFCSLEEITNELNAWDIYCGCWKKP